MKPQSKGAMIARIWRGVTLESKADEYFDYVMETGAKDLRSTEGNQGVYVLQRRCNGQAEFLVVSLWDSLDSVGAFAGPDVERAVYYPRDKDFLLELEASVKHYDILEGP